MVKRLTEDQKEDRKVSAALDFVSACGEWKKIQKECGPFSKESQAALKVAEYTLKQFKRYNK